MPLVRCELSRIVSRSISPQSPCTFELPFSARVRLSASSDMRRFASRSLQISVSSEECCLTSPSYTSSTRLRKPSICSRKGFSSDSSDSRLLCLNCRLFSSSISLAKFLNASRCCCSSAAISSARWARSCSRSAFSSASSFSSACRCAELSAASRVSAISSAFRVSASARSPRSVSAQRRAAGRWTNPATTRAPTASPTNKTKAYSMVVSVRFLPPG